MINNDGSFDDQTDQGWFWVNLLSPVFNNNGTYTKSDGSSDVLKPVWAAFNNAGNVDVQTSGLWLSGGGNNTGSFTVAAGDSSPSAISTRASAAPARRRPRLPPPRRLLPTAP